MKPEAEGSGAPRRSIIVMHDRHSHKTCLVPRLPRVALTTLAKGLYTPYSQHAPSTVSPVSAGRSNPEVLAQAAKSPSPSL